MDDKSTNGLVLALNLVNQLLAGKEDYFARNPNVYLRSEIMDLKQIVSWISTELISLKTSPFFKINEGAVEQAIFNLSDELKVTDPNSKQQWEKLSNALASTNSGNE